MTASVVSRTKEKDRENTNNFNIIAIGCRTSNSYGRLYLDVNPRGALAHI